ncbi:MAG TPA: sugar-binding protein [Gammaproteobacteria bacterium]
MRHPGLFILCGIALAAPAAAQEPLVDPGQKTVRVVRTDVPPVIDGDLGDAVWTRAAVVDDLHQTEPIEYAAPYERTEIFILYDDDALYVGVRLYDTDPALITANNMRQNDNVAQDDRFYVTIDPFNDRRSGYYFGINPNGVRSDGLYRNVSEFYGDWETIFQAAAGRFAEGWTGEFEIPFKSISFDPTTDTWGLNFSRGIVRKDENLAWVSRNRQYNPSIAGLAVGFEGLKQGIGLDVVPSASARQSRAMSSDPLVPDADEAELEPSLDLAYKLTPQLNGSLTINTDFSATEVDDRQVNLDRFPLFFPEKRDFFLREADIFEFGGIGGQRQTSIPGFNSLAQNGRPFYSRRIGLSPTGEPIDLDYGGKISGRAGRFELGVLSVRQDDFASIPADNLSVIRAKAGVLEESTLGFIVTEGNPSGDLHNSLAGIDFQYHNTRLPGGRTLDADAWYQESDTEGVDSDQASFGVGVRVPTSEGIRGRLEYREFEANFNPALGLLSRRGVSDAAASLGYMLRTRGDYLRQWLINVDVEHVDYLDDGSTQTHALMFRPMVLRNSAGDELTLAYQDLSEGLANPFEISPGIVIPPGLYALESWGIQLSTATHRKVVLRTRFVDYRDGGFYAGNRDDSFLELVWKPSPHFGTSLSYDYADIDLPQGSFVTRLVRAGVDFVFSSKLSWVNLIQYDNVTETAGINMRLHFIPQAGRELFFVVNHNLEDPDGDNSFHTATADLTAKVSYTFRF